jgi:hypothetical protein
MDLAKMLTVLELVEPLQGPDFRVWRQTRTGLLSYPLDPAAARAHLATSIYLQMALCPHIVHIVGHTEADHAATPEDVIEASGMARRAIENALRGAPDLTASPNVQARKQHLKAEVELTLRAIASLAGPQVEDPFTDPPTLARAVSEGLLDAPHLRGPAVARGEIITRIQDGASIVVNQAGKPVSEAERLSRFL